MYMFTRAGMSSRYCNAARGGTFLRPSCGRRALVTFAAIAVLFVGLVAVSGCGSSGAVNRYTTFANQILNSLNTQEGELKKYWTLPPAQQVELTKTIADLRKAIAAAQSGLDATDRPQGCAALDEMVGRVVDQSRQLADISTQFGDYPGALGPMAKQADDIVKGLGKLQESQDVRSTISGYLDKARSLESSTCTLSPGEEFQAVNDLFSSFVTLLAKNLQSANDKLTNDEPATIHDTRGERTKEEQAEIDAQIARERKAQVNSVESYVEPIVEEWSTFKARASALIDKAGQTSGLKSKTAEVEGYIGQAVVEIQRLEKQYK